MFVFVNHSGLTLCLIQKTWKLYYSLLFLFIPSKIKEQHLNTLYNQLDTSLPFIHIKAPRPHTSDSPPYTQRGNLNADLNVPFSFYSCLLCLFTLQEGYLQKFCNSNTTVNASGCLCAPLRLFPIE